MNPVRFLTVAVLVTLVSSPASTQMVTSEDRVVSGNANLSTASKEAGGGVRDEDLRKVLGNPRVNVIIMQQRVAASRTEGTKEIEHWVLYTVGRETKFRERKISKEDYEWLIKIADKLHRE